MLSLLLFLSLTHAAEVSVTMDDFSIHETTMLAAKVRNERILVAFKKRNLSAALFVVGGNIQSEADRQLLKAWNSAGHLIGNHTFSHPSYNRTSTDAFEKEIAKCENVLKPFSEFKKFFRFPMLAEGDTVAKRDALRAWLQANGYRNGAVTIDASDWYVDQRLREKIEIDPKFDLKRYRDFYLKHIWERAQYYNELSKKVLGHEVTHTLLIHFNLLNALFLEDLLAMFEAKGWKLISAREAFADPVFKRVHQSMPSGQSLIWGLAKDAGVADLRYPGEDGEYEKPAMDALGL